jgi:hypothetical protein
MVMALSGDGAQLPVICFHSERAVLSPFYNRRSSLPREPHSLPRETCYCCLARLIVQHSSPRAMLLLRLQSMP